MTEIQSLLFYVVSFLLSVFLYKIYIKNDKKIFLVFSMLIPIIVGGFRYMVGTDYPTYKAMFDAGRSTNIGMSLLLAITKTINGNYITVFFLYNLLTVFFLYLSLRNYEKTNRPMILYLYLFLYFTTSFNIIKQGLSISIILFAYKYITQKKPVKWIIFSAIASMFHTTAVICIPLYFIVSSKSNKVRIPFILLTIVLILNFQTILNAATSMPVFSHFTIYADAYTKQINNRMFFVDLIIYTYIFINIKRINKQNRNNNLYFSLYTIGLILELTGFISPYIKRIADYFLISKIILLPELPRVQTSKKNKQLHFLLISATTIVLFIVSTLLLRSAEVIPYNFIGEF